MLLFQVSSVNDQQSQVTGTLQFDNLEDLNKIELPNPEGTYYLDFSLIDQPSSFMLAWVVQVYRHWEKCGFSLSVVNATDEFKQLCLLYGMQSMLKTT